MFITSPVWIDLFTCRRLADCVVSVLVLYLPPPSPLFQEEGKAHAFPREWGRGVGAVRAVHISFHVLLYMVYGVCTCSLECIRVSTRIVSYCVVMLCRVHA